MSELPTDAKERLGYLKGREAGEEAIDLLREVCAELDQGCLVTKGGRTIFIHGNWIDLFDGLREWWEANRE